MREMKWQINVNRRRPFITGLHGRGRVYGSARTRRARVGIRGYIATRTYIRVRARALTLARLLCTSRGAEHTTIYRIGKTISEK